MSDDIVTLLRILNHHTKKLAENESLNDLYRDAFIRCEDLTWKSVKEIMQLRQQVKELCAERDELRRRLCSYEGAWRRVNNPLDEAHLHDRPHEIAKEWGWDCFKEKP